MVKNQKFTTLPKHEFIVGLNLVMDDVVFNSMGNFINRFLAPQWVLRLHQYFTDLILEILEDEVIKKLGFKLPFFWRYRSYKYTSR